MILNYYGLMVNSLNTHIPNNLRNMCVISNPRNMCVINNLRNVLRIILTYIVYLFSATSHNQINELLRAVSIQSGYHRCSLYWLSSSASYPNNLRNVLRIILTYIIYLFSSLTQTIRGAAASRIGTIIIRRCSPYCLSSSASYPNNSKNIFVGTGLDLSTNMCVINNSKNILNKG